MKRRHFLAAGSLAALPLPVLAEGEGAKATAPTTTPNRIGVSSYSFWGFRRDELRDIPTCLDHAELQKVKRHTFLNGALFLMR